MSYASDADWDIEFYEDDSGNEPAVDWIESLEPHKREAVRVAVEQVLAKEGINVCQTEWGKPLGDGLYEFRIRHSADEIRTIYAEAGQRLNVKKAKDAKVLLRLYFMTHGRKIILLIGGYDKGRFGAGKRQDRSIEQAKKLARAIKRGRPGKAG